MGPAGSRPAGVGAPARRARHPATGAWAPPPTRRPRSPLTRAGTQRDHRNRAADRGEVIGPAGRRFSAGRSEHGPGGHDHLAVVSTMPRMPRATGRAAGARALLLHGEERFLVDE